MIRRDPYRRMWSELAEEKNMIFLAGPRQVGKTTLAKMIAEEYPSHIYFNWDSLEDRRLFLRDPLFFTRVPRGKAGAPLVILDEIHKYRGWKNYLKGIYDAYHEAYRFLISGSGRLDIYQRGGDSLAGRYLLFHLWPLSMSELFSEQRPLEDFLRDPLAVPDEQPMAREKWSALMDFSGFPEPYTKAKVLSWRRWSRTYHQRLLREDIRELGGLANVRGSEDLFLLLPGRVGAPLSINNLAGDLGVSFHTVKAWLDVFERFFLSFRLPPWVRKLSRAITKEKKVYLYDTPLVAEAGARFENAVALELNRAVRSWTELGLGDFSLHYVRNKEKQEVDFLIASGQRPILLVETKLSDDRPAAALLKFQNQLDVPAVQLLNEGDGTYRLIPNGNHKVLIAPAWRWLPGLP